MTKYSATTFSGQRVSVDGGDFQNCTFENAKIVYSGGAAPSFDGCKFNMCEFIFEGAALDTVAYLRGLAREPSMAKLVRDLFPELSRR